ncbi:MAG: nitrate reductase [Hyphomicrobium sp.]|uniref:nitrate reductase n=1 Tax=Hyphomicrobium sp. TaxID=82 RepID=UPI0025C0964E|nr:nitrate reductase [Hyphomicrobium sp.]MBZ0209138.1 nitrate reductase [Hyphomicrobium sp.]
MDMAAPRRIKTTCPYCGVGCGVIAEISANGDVAVRGDPNHPANFGRLCSKGSALAETIGLDDRLLTPTVDGERASWDSALNLVAGRFADTIRDHGPDSVAFYVSGQLMTEDYYVANKLMKGFIGSANIDTNSRLCMASSVAGHRRAFGSDTVPGCYEDLELADLVVLTGSNLAWCHPVLYQRLAAAKEKRPRMKVVLIDPRRTATADIADLHLPIKPDSDVVLFLGLLRYLARCGSIKRRYIGAHTSGFKEALQSAEMLDLYDLVRRTGIPAATLERFFALFAATEKTVTVYSQGVNQSTSGTDKVSAIINCHLATGRIGKPGMGPFSVTGQPNAMGGREVGGLANMLAAHMNIEDAEHRDRVQRFWRSPTMASKPGPKAVDMFRAVADGRIQALWIMATNPAVSMPEAENVEAAIRTCPFVVVSDVTAATDTARLAHVLLPAAAWGEKSGTVTNSERRISRQRSFLPLPGEARPDWWIVCEVAKRMGHADAFTYGSAAEIFAEHAALSGFENGGARDFDIGALAATDGDAYDALEPFQWPHPLGSASSARMFADGRFFTADGRARFVDVQAPAVAQIAPAFPLTLNTGRVRDHWHTMTRSGKSPRLSQHCAEPYVELHPHDAARHHVADADLVRVSTGLGAILVRALVSPRQQPGTIFVPMHWNDQFASRARVDALATAITDPISGQPALKSVPARIERFVAATYGFCVLRHKPPTIDAEYWAIARCSSGWRIELALAAPPEDWSAFVTGLLAGDAPVLSAYHDPHTGHRRFAAYAGGRLSAALFFAPEPVAVARDWAVEQLGASCPGRYARVAVMAGRPANGTVDRGATVCACFGVGTNEIAAAAARGCTTVAAIGDALQAGTNCGSCRAEIRNILDARRAPATASAREAVTTI